MSNKASEHLHKLITCMSKPEKRYFKIYTSKHVIGDYSNYQRLFDAIARQSEYDEAKIMKDFKKEAFINRFSITKNRLYNTVLRSLDSFHVNSSIEAQVKKQIHYIEILYRKSLYNQAAKVLSGVKKQAIKHELITSLIEISHWEKRLMEQLNYEEESEESLDSHSRNDAELLQKIADFQKLWQAKSILFNRLYKRGKSRSEEDEEAFSAAIKIMGQNPEQLASTIENTYLYHHLQSAYYYALGKYKDCFKHLQENVRHLESNPNQFQEEPGLFLSVLSNTIFVATQLGEFQTAKQLLDKLKGIPLKLTDSMTEDMSIRIFSTANSLELALYLHSGEFERGVAAIPAIEEDLYKFENNLSAVRKAQFYFNISAICFGAGNYNEALKWINQLLNNVGVDQSLDIHCFAQMYNLIIHLELGNKSLVAYALRSTQRYLETRNRVYKFETVFLEYVNSSLHKRPSASEQERHEELFNQLKTLKQDPHESSVFEYFDFLAWAESKVKGESFATTVKARNAVA